jgi:hypothetical protein
MKKTFILLSTIVGSLSLVACNSGSSSGGGDIPSGCPNGASQCGANSDATQYNTQFPGGSNGSLITATNVIIGNGESVPLTFSVKNITSPVTVNFTSNGGNLQSVPSYTFGDNESSYTIVLQTNNGATTYNITPSVGATNMNPVIVNTSTTSSFQLPLGTYNMKGSNMVLTDCSYQNFSTYNAALFVNTPSGQYLCLSITSGGQSYSECQQSGNERVGELLLPSAYDPTAMFGGYFNASWRSGLFSMNNVLGTAQQCSGMMQTIKWQYLSSSTTIPYPLPPSPTPSSTMFQW